MAESCAVVSTLPAWRAWPCFQGSGVNVTGTGLLLTTAAQDTKTCGSIAVGFSFSGAAMFLPKLVETVHASSQPIGSRMLI